MPKVNIFSVALALASLLGALPPAAGAATFTVTKTVDDDGTCDPTDCALREAILAADDEPGMDTMMDPGGTYLLTIFGPDGPWPETYLSPGREAVA